MDLQIIKQLRDETGAGVMAVRKALDKAKGDIEKAKEILKKKAAEKAVEKADREIKSGRIFTYIHGHRVGAIVKIGCETDFVAKNEQFEALGNEIAMQIAAMDPLSTEDLLDQVYIRDSSKKISDLIAEAIGKIGENITVIEFSRLEI